jgi:hypothetical protein
VAPGPPVLPRHGTAGHDARTGHDALRGRDPDGRGDRPARRGARDGQRLDGRGVRAVRRRRRGGHRDGRGLPPAR